MYIEKTAKTAINLLVMSLLTLSPLFYSQAGEMNKSINDQYDSIYLYNALENKSPFPDLGNIKVSFPDVGGLGSDMEEGSLSTDESLNDFTQKLLDITDKQNFSSETIKKAINDLKNRNFIKKFFVGNDLGVLKFQLVQVKDQVRSLNILSLSNQDNSNKNEIDNQVKLAEDEQAKVEDLLAGQKGKFSLFGWLVYML